MQLYRLQDEFIDAAAERALLMSLSQNRLLYWELISLLTPKWSGKEMASLPPPPLRTARTRHRVRGSSNRRTPRGALLL